MYYLGLTLEVIGIFLGVTSLGMVDTTEPVGALLLAGASLFVAGYLMLRGRLQTVTVALMLTFLKPLDLEELLKKCGQQSALPKRGKYVGPRGPNSQPRDVRQRVDAT